MPKTETTLAEDDAPEQQPSPEPPAVPYTSIQEQEARDACIREGILVNNTALAAIWKAWSAYMAP